MTENIRRFFTVVAKPRTWTNLAYIWLAFPLGLGYFIFFVTGGALTLGLSLLWIGLLLAVAMVLSIRGLEAFERLLSRFLLDEPIAASGEISGTAWQRMKRIAADSATWKGAVFLMLKFPVGLACWIASVVMLATSAAFIAAPFSTYHGEVDLGYWTLVDPTGGFLLSLAGILMLIISLHAHNAMGALWKALSRHLLSAPLATA